MDGLVINTMYMTKYKVGDILICIKDIPIEYCTNNIYIEEDYKSGNICYIKSITDMGHVYKIYLRNNNKFLCWFWGTDVLKEYFETIYERRKRLIEEIS